MTKTIIDLYQGSLKPAVRIARNSRLLQESLELMAKNHQNLDLLLNEEQKPALERYHDTAEEYAFLLAEQAFCDGFSLCAKLLSESFHHAEEITAEP